MEGNATEKVVGEFERESKRLFNELGKNRDLMGMLQVRLSSVLHDQEDKLDKPKDPEVEASLRSPIGRHNRDARMLVEQSNRELSEIIKRLAI